MQTSDIWSMFCLKLFNLLKLRKYSKQYLKNLLDVHGILESNTTKKHITILVNNKK